MNVEEASEFPDWEVLHNSDASGMVENVKDLVLDLDLDLDLDLEGIEGESEGIIRSDYFSLDSQYKYPRARTVPEEEGSIESDNPSWIDPRLESPSLRKESREFWSDSTTSGDRSESDDRKFGDFDAAKNELGFDGIGEIVSESGYLGKFLSDLGGSGTEPTPTKLGDLRDNNTEMGVSDNATSRDELGFSGENEKGVDGSTELMKPGKEKETSSMVWWKLPLELLKYCVFRVSPVWSFSVAAALIGFVILRSRMYKMKRKSSNLQLKLTVDDKKVSQLMSRTARLNEAFSVVKRVPVIRPSLPAAGVAPWPVMSLR